MAQRTSLTLAGRLSAIESVALLKFFCRMDHGEYGFALDWADVMATKLSDLLCIGVVGVAVSFVTLRAEQESSLRLPAELTGYRQWTQLLKSPYQVPMELWVLCQAPTPADWAAKRQKYGPHTEHFIRVYGNNIAFTAVSNREKPAFPPGTVIVKEKLSASPHVAPEGVAFMVKHKEPLFSKTAGWEFLYFPPSEDSRRTHEACASCHSAAPRDYVFGQYPR